MLSKTSSQNNLLHEITRHRNTLYGTYASLTGSLLHTSERKLKVRKLMLTNQSDNRFECQYRVVITKTIRGWVQAKQ